MTNLEWLGKKHYKVQNIQYKPDDDNPELYHLYLYGKPLHDGDFFCTDASFEEHIPPYEFYRAVNNWLAKEHWEWPIADGEKRWLDNLIWSFISCVDYLKISNNIDCHGEVYRELQIYTNANSGYIINIPLRDVGRYFLSGMEPEKKYYLSDLGIKD